MRMTRTAERRQPFINIFIVTCLLFFCNECMFATHGLHLRMDPVKLSGPKSRVESQLKERTEKEDAVKQLNDMVTQLLDNGKLCSDLWKSYDNKDDTASSTQDQGFCKLHDKINADGTKLIRDSVSDSEASENPVDTAVNLCCKTPRKCSDAWVLHPKLCTDKDDGKDRRKKDQNHPLQLNDCGLSIEEYMISECCEEGKTCDEYEEEDAAWKKAWKERREKEEEDNGNKYPELEYHSLPYCETYSRTYAPQNKEEKYTKLERLEKCCQSITQTCEKFDNAKDFCFRKSLLVDDTNNGKLVTSDQRLEMCCRKEPNQASWLKAEGQYISVNNRKSFSSLLDGVRIMRRVNNGAKNNVVSGFTDLPWQYGNFQQSTCMSPFSNTDEAAQIKYDSMRYLDDFNDILENFAKYMNHHVAFGDYPYDVEFHNAPVKGIARMRDKDYGKYAPITKHSCREITDACRGSLYFSNIYGVVVFMELLKNRVEENPVILNDPECKENDPMFCLPCDIKKIEFTNVKNRMTRTKGKDLEPYDVLYRDILVNIKMYKSDYDFHVAEMQVHLKTMAKAKKKGGHTFYRVIRQQTESVEKFDSKFGGYGESKGDSKSFWVRKPKDWWTLDVLRRVPNKCGEGECVEVEDYLKSGDDEYKKENYTPPKLDIEWNQSKDGKRSCDLPTDVEGTKLPVPDTWHEYLNDDNIGEWKKQWKKECKKLNDDVKKQQEGAIAVSTARRQSAIKKGLAIETRSTDVTSLGETKSCDPQAITNDKTKWRARAQTQMAIDMSKCLYSRAWTKELEALKDLPVENEEKVKEEIMERLKNINRKSLVKEVEKENWEIKGNELGLEFLECERANTRSVNLSPAAACCEIETCMYVDFNTFNDEIDSDDEAGKIAQELSMRRTVEKRCVHELSAQAHMCQEQDFRPEVLFLTEFSCDENEKDCRYIHCKKGRKCLKRGCEPDGTKSCELTCTHKENYCSNVKRERCSENKEEDLDHFCKGRGAKGSKPVGDLHRYSFVQGNTEGRVENCCEMDKDKKLKEIALDSFNDSLENAAI